MMEAAIVSVLGNVKLLFAIDALLKTLSLHCIVVFYQDLVLE